MRRAWISCGLLLAIFIWVILQFPDDSLWYDETVNAYLATSSWSTIWEWVTEVDNQLPLHFVALKMWTAGLGDSEFALRLFSLFSALLTVAGLMALGRRLLHSQWGGWTTSLYFAIPGSFLYAAAEVRTYALALALLAWSSVFLWEFCHHPRRKSLLVAYLFTAVLLIYTHYTAWLTIGIQFVFLWILQGRQRWVYGGIIMGALLVSILPWFVALGGRDFNVGTAFAGQVPLETATKTYLSFYAFGQKLFTDVAQQTTILVIGTAILGAVIWIATTWRDSSERIGVAFAVVLAIVPIAALVYAANQIEAKLAGRHAWAMWPGMALLWAGGTQAVGAYLQRQSPRMLLAGVVSAFLLITTHQGRALDEQYSGNFRGAFDILHHEAQPTDILILRDGTLFTAAEYYGSPIPYVGIPSNRLTDVNHQVQLHEAWNMLAPHLTDPPQTIWVLSWQGNTMDPTELAFALPEYLSDSQYHTWLQSDVNNVQLVSYTITRDKPSLIEHIVDYPGIIQVPPDGPSLLGYDVLHNLIDEQCMFIVHTWWWRGETDYLNTMVSMRLIGSSGELLVQRDFPPAGYHFPQEKWTPFVPTLGRVELPYHCNQSVAQVVAIVYDINGEKPQQPIVLAEIEG